MAKGSKSSSEETGTASPARLNEAILDVASWLDMSRAAVGRGELVDLSRIETRITELCADAQTRPADHVPVIRPGFIALIAALEALQAEVTRQHASLRNELQGLSARQRASTAYGGTPRKGR